VFIKLTMERVEKRAEYTWPIILSCSSPPTSPIICSCGGSGGGLPANENGLARKRDEETISTRLGVLAAAAPKALFSLPSTISARGCSPVGPLSGRAPKAPSLSALPASVAASFELRASTLQLAAVACLS